MNPVEHYRIDAELFDYDISDPSSLEEYRRRYEGLFEMAQFRKGQTLVEIGTGSGPAKSLCQALELQHFAVDLSLLNLKKLNQNGIWTRPILASAYELPFADHSVDSVLMSEVLEHIPDPLLALKEINRVLKPQGTLLLSVPWRETLRYH